MCSQITMVRCIQHQLCLQLIHCRVSFVHLHTWNNRLRFHMLVVSLQIIAREYSAVKWVNWLYCCYTAPESSQWFTWGPIQMHCRLCAACWSYWKKYGGLKMPTRLGSSFLTHITVLLVCKSIYTVSMILFIVFTVNSLHASWNFKLGIFRPRNLWTSELHYFLTEVLLIVIFFQICDLLTTYIKLTTPLIINKILWHYINLLCNCYLDGGSTGDRLINMNSFGIHKCTVPGCSKVTDTDTCRLCFICLYSDLLRIDFSWSVTPKQLYSWYVSN